MTDPARSPLASAKLKPWHLDRAAIVYVRQSTPQQVTDHQESTARQYALADRAVALGWPRGQVCVIDEDLGKSGQSIEGRPGFQRLLAEVALDRIGLVLGLEMSRLARSCKESPTISASPCVRRPERRAVSCSGDRRRERQSARSSATRSMPARTAMATGRPIRGGNGQAIRRVAAAVAWPSRTARSS